MRLISQILGTLAIVIGLGLCFLAYNTTTILQMGLNASAVQVTQIYSQASFYGIMAIAAFAFAAVIALGTIAAELAENAKAAVASSQHSETSNISKLGKL